MKKVLITGGSGFIGAEIVKQLYKSGRYDVSVIDNMSVQIHGENWKKSFLYNQIKDKCNFYKGDVCDFSFVQKVMKGVDVLIHLASETGTGQSMYMINQYNTVNVMGTSNLLQAISLMDREKRPEKIILSSSRAVYGEGDYNCPNCGKIFPKGRSTQRMSKKDFAMYCDRCDSESTLIYTDEKSIVRPNSLYAFTKYAQEKMLETMCPALGLKYTIFRFQNVYGVGQSLKNPYTGILSIFSSLMLENKPVNIFEDGEESRDFINVIDIASSVIKAIESTVCDSEIINLGSGKGTSVLEIAQMLKEKYESESELNITGDYRIGDIAHNIADISKAKNLLDFQPTITLEEGISKFCEWVKNQEFDNSSYEKSLEEMSKVGLFIKQEEC